MRGGDSATVGRLRTAILNAMSATQRLVRRGPAGFTPHPALAFAATVDPDLSGVFCFLEQGNRCHDYRKIS